MIFLALQVGSLGPLSAMIDLVASGVSHFNTIPTQRYNRRHRRSEEDLDTARISLEYHLYEIKEKIFLMNLKEFHWNYENMNLLILCNVMKINVSDRWWSVINKIEDFQLFSCH